MSRQAHHQRKRLDTIPEVAEYLGHSPLRPAMADADIQIQVREGDATQLAAWNHLWRRLLSNGEPSNNVRANANPAPADKIELGPKRER